MISSIGITADVHGNILGEYNYDSQKGHYIQAFFENHHSENPNVEKKYLYINEDYGEWQLGPVPGGEEAWLINGNPSQNIPDDSNWEVFDGENWIVDTDLKVTIGGLTPCPGVKIYGLGPVVEVGGELLGIFRPLSSSPPFIMWNGHPIYESKSGKTLVMDNDGKWIIDGTNAILMGSPGRLCPSESNEWVYLDVVDEVQRPADIVVKKL